MSKSEKQMQRGGSGVLRIRPGAKYLGLAPSTYYDHINRNSPRYDRDLPRPISLGKRAKGLDVRELDAYVDKKVAERSGENPND